MKFKKFLKSLNCRSPIFLPTLALGSSEVVTTKLKIKNKYSPVPVGNGGSSGCPFVTSHRSEPLVGGHLVVGTSEGASSGLYVTSYWRECDVAAGLSAEVPAC